VPVRAYSQAEWSRACASSYSGVVNNQYVCSLQRSRNSDGRGATVSDCQKALGIYTKGYKKKMTTEREIERLERMIENWKDDIQTAKEDYIDSLRDRQSNTEGGICFDCIMGSGAVQAERQTDWANVLANGLVGGLAMYMGYQTNKMVSQNNAALGWPSQPYPAWGYGLPFIQNAIYGAMGGGIGQGGFGCAGGMNGGGYGMGPMGMMGTMGNGALYG
ncbi:MAG TPA: hypothetical protein PL182_02890, partial [Pseudobdellovibrionaceae bacterium]|nr:hypothetical protein [Pseudobdellovibrionaceae bacterium]